MTNAWDTQKEQTTEATVRTNHQIITTKEKVREMQLDTYDCSVIIVMKEWFEVQTTALEKKMLVLNTDVTNS